MILTPVADHALPDLLRRFYKALEGDHRAAGVFARIAASYDVPAQPHSHRHSQVVALLRRFDIPMLDEEPVAAFSWDGCCVRTRSEPSVLVHELAHFQVCAPERRRLPDFGLGAGPETGDAVAANAAQQLFGLERDVEEGLASLLGVLWEAELGHPALSAFLEQNWLEGGDRPRNRDHFQRMLGLLRFLGLIDDAGRPLLSLRSMSDAALAASPAASNLSPQAANAARF